MTLFRELFVLFFLHVWTDALGHGPQCNVFKVHRGIVHKAFVNKSLTISCNLKHCHGSPNNVIWTKENLKVWIAVSGTDQMTTSQTYSSSDLLTSYLTFTSISKRHEGNYRCELQLHNISTVSHQINISVSDDSMEEDFNQMANESNSSLWWWPYLFICVGLSILVLVVMFIAILCIYGFKSSGKKKRKRAQVQYTARSMMPQLTPSIQKRDRFVQYSEDTQRHSLDSSPQLQSTSHLSDRGDNILSNRKDSRSSQVVYASLHHLETPLSSTPRPTTDECSEYAAIRVS